MADNKRVIEGIERIHWETTTCLCFTGSVLGAMRHLGTKVTDDFVMGVSGGAFKLFWHPGWSPANCDLLTIGEEPVRRAFNALGYEYTFIQDYNQKDPAHTEEFYKEKIVESIDKEIPVIALGIVGPPEACVIAGYEDGGNVLLGRSYFQEDPGGYFRAENWYDNCHGLILIGEKKPVPPIRQTLQDALDWAIQLAKTPEFSGFLAVEARQTSMRHINGLAAFDALAEALLREEDFPADNPNVVEDHFVIAGIDGISLLMEKRRYASVFLANAAEYGYPGAESLLKASEIYKEESQILHQAAMLVPMGCCCGCGPSGNPSDAKRRKEIADLVLQAKAKDEQAVELIESSLAAMKAG